MITTDHLPIAYKPYPQMKVCSNTIVGRGHLIVIGKVVPLLIGTGPKPLIWMQAIDDVPSKKFAKIVNASIAIHPIVRVAENGSDLIVSVAGKVILRMHEIDHDSVVVSELDLRPLGMDVYGDASHLMAGGSNFCGHIFSGAGAAIELHI